MNARVIRFDPFTPRPRAVHGLGQALGQAAQIGWQPQNISKGSFTFQPGQTYAVLASVSKGKSQQDITSYLAGKGFQITFYCEPPGGCTRNASPIDTWLAGITAPARSGERWVYAEGSFTGKSPWTIPTTASGFVTLVVTYSITNVFLGVTEAPVAPAPVSPGSPTSPPTPSTADQNPSDPYYWPTIPPGTPAVPPSPGNLPTVTPSPSPTTMLPPPPTTPLGSTSSPLTPILIGTGVLAAGGVAWWLVRRRERAARPRPSRR